MENILNNNQNVSLVNGADVTTRLNALKDQIEQGKTEKAKSQANLETFTKQRDDIVAELAGLGVAPENLDAEITRLDQEIAANLAQAEALLQS